MVPRFEILAEKKMLGKRMVMSFSHNKTFDLWQGFMSQRNEIKNNIGVELYSVEVYPPLFFKDFNAEAEFEKWAAVEVADFNTVPAGMETLTIPTGQYAVFIHQGPASNGPETYRYIFMDWLPNSEFLLDNRPHFAVMGAKYKSEDPDSEEELWIPVNKKSNNF